MKGLNDQFMDKREFHAKKFPVVRKDIGEELGDESGLHIHLVFGSARYKNNVRGRHNVKFFFEPKRED